MGTNIKCGMKNGKEIFSICPIKSVLVMPVPDGTTWTKSKANPVLKTGPEGAWDNSSLGWHAVLNSAGVKIKIWYGASDDPNRLGSIGYGESDTRVPVLTIICESLLDTTMTLEVETSQDGSIYIIPLGTRLVADSIVKYKVASTDALANTLTRIPLNEVQHGEYLVTAVSHFRCVCYQGVAIKLVEDLMPPSLTLAKVSINYSEPIIATSSKDGILFLVDELTPAKIHYIRSCRFLIDSSMVKANVPIKLRYGLLGSISLILMKTGLVFIPIQPMSF
jgi:hypothetical protein